jgi:hypothetical protein
MGWVRISDDVFDHGKFARLTPLGQTLWLAGLAWSNRNLSDGLVPRSTAHRLVSFSGCYVKSRSGHRAATVEDAITELVRAGLWAEVDALDAFAIHDYLDYQPSAEEVRHRRELNRRRQEKWRRRRREQDNPFRSEEGPETDEEGFDDPLDP